MKGIYIIGLALMFTLVLASQNTQAVVSGFDYRQSVNTSTVYILSDYQVKVPIDTQTLYGAGKIQADCDDIYFYDTSDNPLPFFGLECNTSGTTDYYVRVSNVSESFYMYYGNTTITSGANGTATFMLYEDWAYSDYTNPLNGNIDNYWYSQTTNETATNYTIIDEELIINVENASSVIGGIGSWIFHQGDYIPDYGFRMMSDVYIFNPSVSATDNLQHFGITNSTHNNLTTYEQPQPIFYNYYASSGDRIGYGWNYNGGDSTSEAAGNNLETDTIRYITEVNQTNEANFTLINMTDGVNEFYVKYDKVVTQAMYDSINGTYEVYFGVRDNPSQNEGMRIEVDNVLVMEYITPEPTVSFGSEESIAAPSDTYVTVQVFSPTATSYTNADTIDVSISLNGTDTITTYLNGVLQNTYSSITQVNDTISPLYVGSYNFTAYGSNESVQVDFTVSNATFTITPVTIASPEENEYYFYENGSVTRNADITTYLNGVLQNTYSGVLSYSGELGYLEVGTYNHTVYATDLYGNFDSYYESIDVINGTAPSVTIDSPTGDTGVPTLPTIISLNVTLTESGTCESNITGSYTAMSGTGTNWYDDASLGSGTYTWDVRCDDAFDNRGTNSFTFTVSEVYVPIMNAHPEFLILPISLILAVIYLIYSVMFSEKKVEGDTLMTLLMIIAVLFVAMIAIFAL